MNRRTPALIACVLLCAAQSTQAFDWLQAQRWEQRLVIVDAPLETAFVEWMAESEDALRERRMAAWVLDDEGLRWLGGSAAQPDAVTDAGALARLRQALEQAAFRPGLHLFGLDGGLKASRAAADQLPELIDAVDSMPMRLRETRAAGRLE